MVHYQPIKLKRLYNGLASVREYVWKRIVEQGRGIRFEVNGVMMYVEAEEVAAAKPSGQVYTSKFDGSEYRLVDFPWRAQTAIEQKRLL